MKINGSKVWNLWMRYLSNFFQIPIRPGIVDEKPLRESPCELSLRRRKFRTFCLNNVKPLKVATAQNFWTRQASFLSSNCFFRVRASVYWLDDAHNRVCCSKHTVIRPGFETISQAPCITCSTKILLDRFMQSFSSAPKERLCWRGVREHVTSKSLLYLCHFFIFFTYVLRRKPGTRRCLKRTYSIRMYSVPPLLQFVSLQNTDWPLNGSGYQRTHKPDGLLEAACLSFEWHQWKNYCLSRLRWLGCEIYIKSKIGSPLFVKNDLYIVYLH